MTSRKTFQTFVVLLALVFGVPSGSALSQMRVPDDECPGSFTTPIGLGACDRILPGNKRCFRTDSAIMAINQGTSEVVWGKSFTAENCDGCPEVTPSDSDQREWLEVEYTEDVTATVASGIEDLEADLIRMRLEMSIGHFLKRTLKTSVRCGDSAFPGCKTQPFTAGVLVLEGIENRMRHRYEWRAKVDHVPNHPPSFDPTDHRQLHAYRMSYLLIGCPYCGKRPSYHPYDLPPTAASTRTSTVVGSAYIAVGCKSGDQVDCP